LSCGRTIPFVRHGCVEKCSLINEWYRWGMAIASHRELDVCIHLHGPAENIQTRRWPKSVCNWLTSNQASRQARPTCSTPIVPQPIGSKSPFNCRNHTEYSAPIGRPSLGPARPAVCLLSGQLSVGWDARCKLVNW